MADILKGLVSGEALKSASVKRAKKFDEDTLTAATVPALETKLEAAKLEGWEEAKRNRRSIRIRKRKPSDRQLEDDVWSLLYRLGFKEMNEIRHFSMKLSETTEPRQIDVFAKDDDVAFVIECTQAEDPKKKSIKILIDKINGMRDDVIKVIHSHYGKETKLKIKFAIATRNIDLKANDRERCAEAKIPIITEDELKYFNQLADLLKHAARYQFLSKYLRGETVEGLKREKAPATRGRVGSTTFYNLLISPFELLKIAYISHKAKSAEDDFESYQRMVKGKRLSEIGQYIDEGGTFPTNIVVNIKTDKPLQFDVREKVGDTAVGTLHLPGQYGSAWVIDGQHRLYGYGHATRFKDEKEAQAVVSVLAYENLSPADEVKLFIDINTKQIKVSRKLSNELIASLNIESEDPAERLEAICARIPLYMDSMTGSPINGRVNTVSQDKNSFCCLSQTSMQDGIDENNFVGTVVAPKGGKPHLYPGPLAHASGSSKKTLAKASKVLAGYLNVFASGMPDHWKLGDAKGGYLCTNNGTRSLLMVLKELIIFVEDKNSVKFVNCDADDIVDLLIPYVEPLVEYFQSASDEQIAAFRSRGSSLLTVGQNAKQMMAIISEALPEFCPPKVKEYLEKRDVEGTKIARSMIDEINEILFNDVTTKLKEAYGTEKNAWWMKGVPENVRIPAAEKHNKKEGERDPWNYIFLIDYPAIVLYKDNWEKLFKSHYNFYGKGKKGLLPRWITKINEARQVTHHAEKGPLDREDVEFVRKVHRLVLMHIRDGVPLTPNKQYLSDNDEAKAITKEDVLETV
jgi:DGQHR domain-containing protein